MCVLVCWAIAISPCLYSLISPSRCQVFLEKYLSGIKGWYDRPSGHTLQLMKANAIAEGGRVFLMEMGNGALWHIGGIRV